MTDLTQATGLPRLPLSLEDLSASVQRLTQENQFLLGQINSLDANLKASELIARAESAKLQSKSTSTPGLKANKPPMFSGKGTELSSFLNRCKLCFLSGTSEEAKILFASSYLEGSAYDWLQTSVYFGSFSSELTFSQFESDISKAFGQVDEEATSFNALLKIIQGNHSVGDYNNRFNLLAAKAKLSDQATLMRLYRNGLSMDVVRNLPGQYHSYKSVGDIQSKASEIYFDLQLDSRRPVHHGSNSNFPTTAMDLSTMSTSAPLPAEERTRRRLNNLCAYCGKQGCPGGGPVRDVALCSELAKKRSGSGNLIRRP